MRYSLHFKKHVPNPVLLVRSVWHETNRSTTASRYSSPGIWVTACPALKNLRSFPVRDEHGTHQFWLGTWWGKCSTLNWGLIWTCLEGHACGWMSVKLGGSFYPMAVSLQHVNFAEISAKSTKDTTLLYPIEIHQQTQPTKLHLCPTNILSYLENLILSSQQNGAFFGQNGRNMVQNKQEIVLFGSKWWKHGPKQTRNGVCFGQKWFVFWSTNSSFDNLNGPSIVCLDTHRWPAHARAAHPWHRRYRLRPNKWWVDMLKTRKTHGISRFFWKFCLWIGF